MQVRLLLKRLQEMISAKPWNHITGVLLPLVSSNLLLTSFWASSTASSILKFLLTGHWDFLSHSSEFLCLPLTAIHSHAHIFRSLFQQDHFQVQNLCCLLQGRMLLPDSTRLLVRIHLFLCEGLRAPVSCWQLHGDHPHPLVMWVSPKCSHASWQPTKENAYMCVFLFSFFSSFMYIVLTSLVCFIPLLYFYFLATAFMIHEIKKLKLVQTNGRFCCVVRMRRPSCAEEANGASCHLLVHSLLQVSCWTW